MDRFVQYIADRLNADVIAVKLLVSIFLGYPIAFVYIIKAKNWSLAYRHLYLFISGVFLCYWNFGSDIFHLFCGIFFTMLFNYYFLKSKVAVVFAFIFNMIYMVLGSHICNRGTYDINWTTPYCILCLRLIGLSFDLYDSSKPEAARSGFQKRTALSKFPTILETLAFCFTPTTFLIGPQFSMKHYQSFIDGSLRPSIILRNRTLMKRVFYNVKVRRTLSCLIFGTIGIIVLSKFLVLYSADKMLTPDFQQNWNFIHRWFYLMVFSQVILMRYVCLWMISEGSCILLGLGCTGFVHIRCKDPKLNLDLGLNLQSNTQSSSSLRDGPVLKRRDSAIEWSMADNRIKSMAELYDPNQVEVWEAEHTACANVSLMRFIFATSTDDLVGGFNINTNRWVLEYVYKRLKFLGNKQLSQVITLTYLALWHGTYSGYFMNFFMELICVMVEHDFMNIVRRSKFNHFFNETILGRGISIICGKIHIYFMLTLPIVAFYLLQFKYWFSVYKSVYFIGLIYLLWPILRPIVLMVFSPGPKSPDAIAKERRLSNPSSSNRRLFNGTPNQSFEKLDCLKE